MNRTPGLILLILGMVLLHRLATAQVVQMAGSAAFRAEHCHGSTAPADDSGDDDDGDDDSGSDESE